jgi:RluA family pseudouridine synthase
MNPAPSFHIRVTRREQGALLARFIRNHLASPVSLRAVKRSLESGAARVNGKIETFASTRLNEGDRVAYAPNPRDLEPRRCVVTPSSILFEDEHLLVLAKPAGFASTPTGNRTTSTFEALRDYLKTRGGGYLEPLHRLDRDTSGALAFARNPGACRFYLDCFRRRHVRKTYHALIHGIPEPARGMLSFRLRLRKKGQGFEHWETTDGSRGREAITRYRVLRSGPEVSLVCIHPLTGRTHQIRVHFSRIGHPVLGDLIYGRKHENRSLRPPRLLLHASLLELPRFEGEGLLSIHAPWPDDFRNELKIRVPAPE